MRRAIDRPTYHSQRVSRIEHARCINKQRSDGWIFVTRRVKRNNNISRLLPMKRFAFFRFASTKGLDRASLLNIIQVDITYKVISRFFAIGRRKKIDLRVFFFFLSFSVDEDVTSEKEEGRTSSIQRSYTWKHSVDRKEMLKRRPRFLDVL